MLYRKQGFPEEDEIVLCTVTSVQYNSVFCTLDAYGKSGMIHISEVSPGRIRNLRDFVQEGKKIVCKILRVDLERGHIDLSLRRVNEGQRREYNGIIKQEQKAEKIIEGLAAELKKPVGEVYAAIATPILQQYEYLCLAFQDHVDETADLRTLGVPAAYQDLLIARVIDKIKPKRVSIGGTLSLTTYAENGIVVVRDALAAAQRASKDLRLNYLGSGKYQVTVEAEEYKDAEETLKSALDAAIAIVKKSDGGAAEFARAD